MRRISCVALALAVVSAGAGCESMRTARVPAAEAVEVVSSVPQAQYPGYSNGFSSILSGGPIPNYGPGLPPIDPMVALTGIEIQMVPESASASVYPPGGEPAVAADALASPQPAVPVYVTQYVPQYIPQTIIVESPPQIIYQPEYIPYPVYQPIFIIQRRHEIGNGIEVCDPDPRPRGPIIIHHPGDHNPPRGGNGGLLAGRIPPPPLALQQPASVAGLIPTGPRGGVSNRAETAVIKALPAAVVPSRAALADKPVTTLTSVPPAHVRMPTISKVDVGSVPAVTRTSPVRVIPTVRAADSPVQSSLSPTTVRTVSPATVTPSPRILSSSDDSKKGGQIGAPGLPGNGPVINQIGRNR